LVFRFEFERFAVWIKKFYFPSHLRLGPWIIGIMLGFVMYNSRDQKVKINKTLDAILWILAISLFLVINLCFYSFVQVKENTSNMFPHALYGSFYRTGWSLSVAWIIFACQNGSGGIIRWFLSLKQWQPLGRMGLSIYLSHRMYQIITTFNQKFPIQWDFFNEIQKFYGDVLVAIFFGTLLYLAVETPVMLIENYVHRKLKNRK
jgi:peptidoglycan/LPS O-acetylase OafA/YrhL